MAEKKDKDKKEKKAAINSLADLQSAIKKQHGDDAISIGLDQIVQVETFPTGVATIDAALGCCGIPCGRIIEIFGNESSGKTTTCLHLVKACQTHYFPDKGRNGIAAIIDAEHALDPVWATKCGVNMDNILFSQPSSGEEAFEILSMIAQSGQVDLVIVDSVSSLVPLKELQGEIGDANVGSQARLMSQGLRMVKGHLNQTKTTVVFTNQVRQKIGVMYGSPDTTSGGLALRFYASIRAQIIKGQAIKDDDENVVGFSPTMKIIKNKCAPPFTTAEYVINVGHPSVPEYGINENESLLRYGIDTKLLTKKSNYIYLGEQCIGNGMTAAMRLLRENEQLRTELRNKIYSVLRKTMNVAANSSANDSIDTDLTDELADELLDGNDNV